MTVTALPPSRRARERRLWRREAAARLAAECGGVVDRRQLSRLGITRFEVRNEIAAGWWTSAGVHTLVVGGQTAPSGSGLLWRAVWETAPGALLDGASALVESGLAGFTPSVIDVSVPYRARIREVAGVRVRRRRSLVAARRGGVPRTTVEVATIRGAQLAVSDRQAALLICMPIQQRLTTPERLQWAWAQVGHSPNRGFLDDVIGDVCDGAHSLGELDFGGMCGRRGFPAPVRQSVRRGPNGRIYLDAEFACGLIVEIDGVQHREGLNEVDDALRANAVSLGKRPVLRIPVLGLRVCPDAFLDQVAAALQATPALPAGR